MILRGRWAPPLTRDIIPEWSGVVNCFFGFSPAFRAVSFSALPGRHRKDGGTIIFYKKSFKNLDR